MLTCLIKEVQARAELTLKTPGAKQEAERLGFLEGECWVYQTWDQEKQRNVRDTTPEGGAAATRLLAAARELTRYAGFGWHDKYLRKRAQSEWLGIMHAVAFVEFLLMVLTLPAGPHGTAVSIAGWDPA